MAVTESDLRRAVARFAEGVTIVAAAPKKGQPRSMTVSAFLFVSFEPPLIVTSLASNAPTLEIIRRRGVFGVSILSVDQQELSDRFAGEEDGRFEGVRYDVLASGSVTLGGTIATLDCDVEAGAAAGRPHGVGGASAGRHVSGGPPAALLPRQVRLVPHPHRLSHGSLAGR
jgi:flavin reductase (DIM6/NTAB) family NADH-FMN oxidoreductase RutF